MRHILPPEQRRAGILRAASRVFASRGFGGARIADIAAEAGIAQGLVYRYYPSKDALFQGLVEESLARLTEAIASLEAMPLDAGGKIAFALEQLLTRLERDEDFARRLMLIAQAGSMEDAPSEARSAWAAGRDRPYKAIAGIIARGQSEGSIAEGPAEDLALLFWTLVKGLAQHRLALGPAYRSPDMTLLRRIFLARPELQP